MIEQGRITSEQRIEVPQVPLVLDKKFIGQLAAGTATPDVMNVENWKATNTAPQLVTNFLRGQDTQELLIEGDGFTTLDHGTNIFMTAAVDLLLAANTIYHFVYRSGKWIQVG